MIQYHNPVLVWRRLHFIKLTMNNLPIRLAATAELLQWHQRNIDSWKELFPSLESLSTLNKNIEPRIGPHGIGMFSTAPIESNEVLVTIDPRMLITINYAIPVSCIGQLFTASFSDF